MIDKIVCIGGLSDGETVEYDDAKGPEETVLLADPRPTQFEIPLDANYRPPEAAPRRERQFYNLERFTSQSGEVHYLYRHAVLSLDEAMTLLLYRYRNEAGRDEMQAVINAWRVEGPSPTLHREWQNRLIHYWPTLAKAVINLVEWRYSNARRR